MVLMTVTEVTTRIAIVGMAGTIGLLLVSRAQLFRRHEDRVDGARRFARHSASPVTASHLPLGRASLRRSGTVSSRLFGLVVITIAVGLSVGIGLSVALVGALAASGVIGT
jgi:hypothetical protein